MRRSVRIYRQQAHKLPLDTQLQIVRAAGEDDGQPGWRKALSTLSLVCSGWRDAAQGKLFESILMERVDLAGLLNAHPRLGRFVQSVGCDVGVASSLVVLAQLKLLPSLHTVMNLYWPLSEDQLQPLAPPDDDRPSLRQLALSVIATHTPGTAAPPPAALSPFFNLRSLRVLQMGFGPGAVISMVDLQGVSHNLVDLSLLGYTSMDDALLEVVSKRFPDIQHLTLQLDLAETSPPSARIPLANFPRLETLGVALRDVFAALGSPSAALQMISIALKEPKAAADIKLQVSTLGRAITEICDGVDAEPSRYPSLGCVQLIGQGAELDEDGHGFIAIARRLRKVGLPLYVGGRRELCDDESDDEA